MSALPPKADITERCRDVRFVPITDIVLPLHSITLIDKLLRDGARSASVGRDRGL
jgi:hypothetical protein